MTFPDTSHINKADRLLLVDIVERAMRDLPSLADVVRAGDLHMDLLATHAKVPLRLRAFRDARPFDFAHDVVGIYRHLNRETCELEGCFLPRFAA